NGQPYKKHVADVRDIVAGFTTALGKPGAVGEIFQLAAPTPYTSAETIPYLAQKLGIDYIDVNLAGHLTTNYEFDMSKGQRLFGYQPSFDMLKMIDEALAFRAGNTTGVIPTHV
ncbi:MAG: hypothetical protein NTU48_09195, partial [Legionellales bacterium]|nr:hypothetical protein [Legionellales bacterium]